MDKYFLFIATVFSFLSLKAQSITDSAKIISYEEKLILRVNFDTNTEDFVASFKNSDRDFQTKLSINNKIRTSFSIDYKIISAAISFTPDFIPGNDDNALKGKSSYTDFTFRFFPDQIIQTLGYRNVKGFYLDNMEDFFPDWQKGKHPYFQFPDLKIQTFSGSTSYVFNKDFSLKSILYQREWQNYSSGSLIPEIEYDLSLFKNKIDEARTKETQFNLGFNLGYHYNWIIRKKVNIAPYIFTGIGRKWTSYKADIQNSKAEKNNYWVGNAGAGIHLGYNSETFFSGIKLNLNSSYYREDSSSEITNTNVFGLIYLGYRFPPPKILKRSYDNVKKKVPLL
ncbi:MULTISPECIES: DUF4421 family protein [Chryseobacterium]|uniref:DUF4421 domain-containing protein n=1 Tax=Chryseobacterium taihuense TaxID=1141221 RepID=A0A4U8WE22_9FLAO|nr:MULTISPECIES: DUF4421 family protein [Chryseobacterium]QQV02311.1 DUF4421 family protein [Chryseobacterium sp. FDAARGOS 1104]VFB04443.1 Uncharacterised protein [Chryseobacterium taihuense]